MMEKKLIDNFNCAYNYTCSDCMIEDVCNDCNCLVCSSYNCENCARNPYNYDMEYYQIND